MEKYILLAIEVGDPTFYDTDRKRRKFWIDLVKEFFKKSSARELYSRLSLVPRQKSRVWGP